ncbi:aspartic proteinase nepenthesin-2-like [Arachis stenosperma]|uniref:aspartic proteinase nepenthesin-2-like n=1 Tax=Arachis stenosperma TaxID=217475 RepID=UPI0025AB6968|nr:aspartic proteinase nepenthesin-2-like [Arachis stenosperma]
MANISVGQPSTPQLVVMDTASEIFWIMCNPCTNCDQHLGQLFGPSKSSTYIQLCRTPCGFRGCNCHPLDRSPFIITYADNSSASGTLGYETLVFETSDEGSIQIPNIEFGCGRDIVYNNDPGYNGILGLNNAPMSLASQIGHKFSYCIGSLADKSSNYNQLILGEGADLEGYPTHFQALRGMYYITMEGISVGERRLDIPPATFEMKENDAGGVIIDTGSTLTYLPDDVQIYYTRKDLVGFPVVTFHFAQGADLALDTGSFFEQLTDSVFCMAIGPVSATGVDNRSSVIGLLAQQGYNVGYDLVNQIVYFQRIHCQLLSG